MTPHTPRHGEGGSVRDRPRPLATMEGCECDPGCGTMEVLDRSTHPSPTLMYEWLTSTEGFIPRGQCGEWTQGLIACNVTANAVIILAYLLIPLVLIYFWRRRRHDFPHADVLVGFALFISSCALTHLCNVLVFWWPPYRLYTLVDLLCAMMSVPVAVIVPYTARYLLKIPSMEEYRQTVAELEAEVYNRIDLQSALEERNERLRREADTMREQLIELQKRRGYEEETKDLLAQLQRIRNS